jgi:flavin-binding protein dodecin
MGVLKVIEVLSSSKNSWEDATRNAVKEAGKSVKNIRSVYVKEHSCVVDDNDLIHFRVNVKITFEVN